MGNARITKHPILPVDKISESIQWPEAQCKTWRDDLFSLICSWNTCIWSS